MNAEQRAERERTLCSWLRALRLPTGSLAKFDSLQAITILGVAVLARMS